MEIAHGTITPEGLRNLFVGVRSPRIPKAYNHTEERRELVNRTTWCFNRLEQLEAKLQYLHPGPREKSKFERTPSPTLNPKLQTTHGKVGYNCDVLDSNGMENAND